jgi:hypothetical protein
MGMSMVFGIATNAGGTVDIQTKLGIGTTIELRIPIAKPAPVAPSPRAIAHVTLKNRRVEAYVAVVLEALGLRALHQVPEGSDASDLWVTDAAGITPQRIRSYLELHRESKAVVIGGNKEFADAGAVTASAETPLAGLRTAIVTAAGG